MNSTLLSSNKVKECIRRVEIQDEQLRHLRFKVEIHATRLLKTSGTEREQAYQLYKQAMRRLLSYLSLALLNRCFAMWLATYHDLDHVRARNTKTMAGQAARPSQ
ncbi:hypothetical protein [Massilia eburnea]|uniref:hypothetical protein n=1 Tax=Massilia eburnea TaxID=1776165 RepID=UPI003D6B3ACD